MNALTPRAIIEDPDSFAETITLSSGEQFLFRPLKPEDSTLLADYFNSLSPDTRKRFGPHPFTAEEAKKLCQEIDGEKALRLVAVTSNIWQPQIVAYSILSFLLDAAAEKRYRTYGMSLNGDSVCRLAPSVADAYQGCGLGSLVMERALALTRRLGWKQVILQGGVQATNLGAIRFYEKFGFRQVGSFFTTVENYDMMIDLTQVITAVPTFDL